MTTEKRETTEDFIYATEEFRDTIATVTKEGKRIWIYPKKPSGNFFNYRKLVSYILLLLLFGMPFIKVNGQPFIMFNVLERKFVLFSIVYQYLRQFQQPSGIGDVRTAFSYAPGYFLLSQAEAANHFSDGSGLFHWIQIFPLHVLDDRYQHILFF